MINSDAFAQRLQKVMEYYSESASSFSDKIGVQRSSISHILSGRNKPSLDFVLKIMSAFPEVELYWLLNGKGRFPSGANKSNVEKEINREIEEPQNPANIVSDKQIDKIVIFYKDGTFTEFQKSRT